MEGTRDKILGLLQKRGSGTVDGLSKSLGLTSATVRRHLDILQRDHLITYEEIRKKTGRPEYSFSLTEEGHEFLPKHYNRLLSSLLRELGQLSPKETQGKGGKDVLRIAFQRMAQQLIEDRRADIDGMSLQERLEILRGVLESQGFVPEAEYINGTVTINLLNCPFRYVAMGNQAVCQYDDSLISGILQIPIKQGTCIQKGDYCCTYLAKLNGPKLAESLS